MDTSEQHVDYRNSRIQRENEDLEKSDHCFVSHYFTLDHPELICIAIVIVELENINCDHTIEIEEGLSYK